MTAAQLQIIRWGKLLIVGIKREREFSGSEREKNLEAEFLAKIESKDLVA